MRRLSISLVSGIFLLVWAASAWADPPQDRQSRPATIADRTQNMKKLDGYFPLYWDEAAGTLFMEISRFNQDVLYLNGLAAGLGSNDIGLDRAQLGGTRVVKFQRIGPKILMIEPNQDYRATASNAAERKAVEDAFAQSVIFGFTVAAENDGRVLVDLTDFLMRDAHGVAGRLTPAQYRFDRPRPRRASPRKQKSGAAAKPSI